MAEDFYKTLGVKRDAAAAEIEKAYRTLARKYHPDLNPDDKTAKKKFQAVQAAFDVLSDPKKRELYDRYGSSFEDVARANAQPGGGGFRPGQMPPGAEDFDFSQLFGDQFGGGQGASPTFFLSFAELAGAAGGRRRRGAGPQPGPGCRIFDRDSFQPGGHRRPDPAFDST